MISNLAVNEPDVPRLRVTTLLMLGPAAVSIVGAQLNDTALLLADSVEQRGADHRGAFEGRDAGEGDGEAFTLDILDAEPAAEGLAVATERLAQREAPLDAGSRRALLAGLQGLGAASATGTLRRRSPPCSGRHGAASPHWPPRPRDAGTTVSGRPSR
jgi:hypothetical protein